MAQRGPWNWFCGCCGSSESELSTTDENYGDVTVVPPSEGTLPSSVPVCSVPEDVSSNPTPVPEDIPTSAASEEGSTSRCNPSPVPEDIASSHDLTSIAPEDVGASIRDPTSEEGSSTRRRSPLSVPEEIARSHQPTSSSPADVSTSSRNPTSAFPEDSSANSRSIGYGMISVADAAIWMHNMTLVEQNNMPPVDAPHESPWVLAPSQQAGPLSSDGLTPPQLPSRDPEGSITSEDVNQPGFQALVALQSIQHSTSTTEEQSVISIGEAGLPPTISVIQPEEQPHTDTVSNGEVTPETLSQDSDEDDNIHDHPCH